MSSSQPAFDPNHPLLADLARLDKLKNKMFARICGVLDVPPSNPGRVLAGGEAAEDVLQLSLLELLRTDPAYAKSWECLAMTIAHHRAVDAVRRATAGRRDGEAEIDVMRLGADDTTSCIDELSSSGRLNYEVDPEELYLEAERQETLWDLAREILGDQDLTIFRASHYHGLKPPAIADLPGVAVGDRQVRNRIPEIERQLTTAALTDPRFSSREPNAGHPNKKGDENGH